MTSDKIRLAAKIWIMTNLWAMVGDSFLVMALYRKYRTIPDFLLPWLIIYSTVIISLIFLTVFSVWILSDPYKPLTSIPGMSRFELFL